MVLETVVKEFQKELPKFREITEKFYDKELSVKEYKGLSGGFGSYAQKGADKSMLRLRLAGGRLPKEKLKFIADMIDAYDIDLVHMTTCQTIQLHNLNKDAVCEIMEKALEVGIVTRGGGGDFPRNVMVSPLSGVECGEYFDVLPYAEAAADYLMKIIGTVKLPRKLKVCFSNSPKNRPHATFRDLGFVAREDGLFDVYSAGGLGNNPKMGVKVDEKVAPTEILYYIKAMVDTFVTYGNYENRAKARTRYMQEVLGTDGYRDAYLQKLADVKAAGGMELCVAPEQSVANAAEKKSSQLSSHEEISGKRLLSQKQTGLYTVVYHPLGGVFHENKFRTYYDTIQDMEAVELRIAPDETLYFINLTAEEAKKVLSVTEDGAKTLFETSVSCIGNSICQVGLRDSQSALFRILEETRKHAFADGVLPRFYISGCTSSCGTHQIGTIGFQGSVKRVNDVVEPAFVMFLNGSELQGEERFGTKLGIICQKDMPAFFVELGEVVTKSGKSFDDWFAADPDAFVSLAEKYF